MIEDDPEGMSKEKKADMILDVCGDVQRFSIFDQGKKLGIVYHKEDLTFVDFLIFGWIQDKRGINNE